MPTASIGDVGAQAAGQLPDGPGDVVVRRKNQIGTEVGCRDAAALDRVHDDGP